MSPQRDTTDRTLLFGGEDAPEVTMVDLDYDPATLLPPCPLKRIRAFERSRGRSWGAEFRLPEAYVDHVRRFHGGCPRKACFRTAASETRMVCRFFNFLDRKDLAPPLTPTWRQWSDEPDVRLDYSVVRFFDYEFWGVRMEEAGRCLPVAGLDTAGHNCRDMDEFDLLCLDYNSGGEPPVVVWEFPGFRPVVPVCGSFEVFLTQLVGCPEGVISGPAENW